jgi:galacturan 1,4-alpha-galacturonidase
MRTTRLLQSSLLGLLVTLANAGRMDRNGSTCILTPGGEGVDDSPAIIDAFSQCGHNGHIIFQNATFHIERVMNTTGLRNCVVDIKGTLLVSGCHIFDEFSCIDTLSSGARILSTG